MSAAGQKPGSMSAAVELGMPPAGARVVVAMSGGVDSSVAAALLVEAGYEVVGISLRLAEERPGGRSSGCCSLEDFQDAARVAAALGVPHYVFDMREAFRRDVVTPFVEEYLAGRTPSPCVLCNRSIKFSALRRRAAELGAAWVATGHYARRVTEAGRHRLLRGRDEAKDQSYFLFEMTQEALAHTLFPVGDLTKEEVRAFATSRGIATADKAESQEICFVPDGGYADFVEKIAPGRTRAGDFVDGEGRVVGSHGGVHRYTVGQRRGLGIAHTEPLYVESVDAASGAVRVAPRAALLRRGLLADGATWTSGQAEPDGSRVEARIRHRHRPVPATLTVLADGRVEVIFDEPIEAISPGQAVVFYRGDEVVGGAWIRESLPVVAAADGDALAGDDAAADGGAASGDGRANAGDATGSRLAPGPGASA